MPIVVGVLAVRGRVVAIGRGLVARRLGHRGPDRLLRQRGGIVTFGRCGVAQRSVVITSISGPVALVGGVVTPVGGLVAFGAARASFVVNQHVPPLS